MPTDQIELYGYKRYKIAKMQPYKELRVAFWTVPRITNREKKSPVVDKDSLRDLAPDFNRGEAVFERNTLKIIEINVFRNEQFNFGTRGKVSTVQAFGFQGTEEVFHGSIVIRTTRTGHGGGNMIFLSQVEVCLVNDLQICDKVYFDAALDDMCSCFIAIPEEEIKGMLNALGVQYPAALVNYFERFINKMRNFCQK